MNNFRLLAATLILLAPPVFAQNTAEYTSNAGSLVEEFVSDGFNYRLDLSDEAYTYVDFTDEVPDASFAAIRFAPNAFSLVVVEDIEFGLTSELYAEMVQNSMESRFVGEFEGEFKGFEDLGSVEERGMHVFQKKIYTIVGNLPITYVVSAYVDGSRAYQLLTFASGQSDEEVLAEANKLLGGFSVIDAERNRQVAVASADSNVKDYRSTTFGYRFRARDRGWFGWDDLAETNEGADYGALAARGYGAVVMPACWDGARPTDNAIYRVMMQQFGEDYPSAFIDEESDIEKDGATGKLLVGTEDNEGESYIYLQWIVANENCAYTQAAWGPENGKNTRQDIEKVWRDFSITGTPTALNNQYNNQRERDVNAYLVNAFGLHYYDSRSFRDAFDYFQQANALVPDDDAYIVNAVRALVEVDAFREAADWIEPRMGPFADDRVVQSWDAWLAYQTDDPDKALRIYEWLFDTDYRDNDDFGAYMELLASANRWQDLDSEFAAYTEGQVDDGTRLLQVQLLTRRERYDEALLVLDGMTEGRPYNADLAYERMTVLDQMGKPAETLKIADELIAEGYRSLQSYFFKGDAEYQLRSYRKARESFEIALTYSPAHATIKEYLESIDNMLGEGDTSTISQEIVAVSMPRNMQQSYAALDGETVEDGYGAVFLARVSGYDFDGSDVLRSTSFRKIQVHDDNGVTQFSTLEFDFDPSYEQLYVNSLIVRNADGEVLGEGDLGTYYITNSESGYEASTERTVNLPVPSLAPGVVIEAVVTRRTYVAEDSFPLETLYLSTDRPIEFSAVFVSGKHDLLKYELSDLGDPHTDGDALVFQAKSPIAFRWEPLQPYFDQILPWVQLGTVEENWAIAGTDYLRKIEDKVDVDSVADRAQRLVDGVDSEARKIEILSAWVQDEIHYEALEFGRRAYIPKTARETMRDRYGDCKDHALLLYSLLEAAGIDAALALVNLNQQVLPGMPNTDQFDHMIVAVTTTDGLIFIDSTDKDLRLGRLAPRSMAGNFALTLDDTPDLIDIPQYETMLTGIDVERVVEARSDGYLDVTETAQFTGYQAAELRGQLRSIETSEMQASLQRWVATRYSDAELTEYYVDNIFDAAYDLVLEIKYTLPVDTDGSFDTPGFLEAYYLEYDRVADRRFPFQHFFPLRLSAVTSVKIPSGMRLDEATQKPDRGESRFGNWQREVSQADDSWEVRFDYVASEERFSPEDYRDFAEFQRQAVDAVEQPFVLQ